MIENVSRLVCWTTREGNFNKGYIAEFLPKGKKIPEWYITGQKHPKGIRFKTHQRVSKRDDRYIVDCGVQIIAYDDNGEAIKDVVYHLVPISHVEFLR